MRIMNESKLVEVHIDFSGEEWNVWCQSENARFIHFDLVDVVHEDYSDRVGMIIRLPEHHKAEVLGEIEAEVAQRDLFKEI